MDAQGQKAKHRPKHGRKPPGLEKPTKLARPLCSCKVLDQTNKATVGPKPLKPYTLNAKPQILNPKPRVGLHGRMSRSRAEGGLAPMWRIRGFVQSSACNIGT